MTYVPEGSACPPTCKHPNGYPNCPTKRVEGCQCPQGKVQDVDVNGNVRCVNPPECIVCKLDGIIYNEGEIIPTSSVPSKKSINNDCREW